MMVPHILLRKCTFGYACAAVVGSCMTYSEGKFRQTSVPSLEAGLLNHTLWWFILLTQFVCMLLYKEAHPPLNTSVGGAGRGRV